MKITGNEPAFPNSIVVGPGDHAYYDGMTLRQYFVGQVAASVAAIEYKTRQDFARHCVELADAIIEELNKKE